MSFSPIYDTTHVNDDINRFVCFKKDDKALVDITKVKYYEKFNDSYEANNNTSTFIPSISIDGSIYTSMDKINLSVLDFRYYNLAKGKLSHLYPTTDRPDVNIVSEISLAYTLSLLEKESFLSLSYGGHGLETKININNLDYIEVNQKLDTGVVIVSCELGELTGEDLPKLLQLLRFS